MMMMITRNNDTKQADEAACKSIADKANAVDPGYIEYNSDISNSRNISLKIPWKV